MGTLLKRTEDILSFRSGGKRAGLIERKSFMFLDGFILLLRDYGMPVSLTDAIDFYRGMERGLAPDLESLFVFARLCFVRRVEHMDAYERAFAFHFYGIDLPRVAEGDPELLNTPQFRRWLKEAVRKGELPPQALWTFPPGELMNASGRPCASRWRSTTAAAAGWAPAAIPRSAIRETRRAESGFLAKAGSSPPRR